MKRVSLNLQPLDTPTPAPIPVYSTTSNIAPKIGNGASVSVVSTDSKSPPYFDNPQLQTTYLSLQKTTIPAQTESEVARLVGRVQRVYDMGRYLLLSAGSQTAMNLQVCNRIEYYIMMMSIYGGRIKWWDELYFEIVNVAQRNTVSGLQ